MRRFIAILIIILVIPAAALSAHPHMFIDMKLTPVFSEEGFEGMQVIWLFDMVFTGSVLMDNGFGWTESLSKSQVEIIRDTAFINLLNYNYFSYFNVGGKISRAKTFKDFKAFISDNRLGYDFFLPYEGAQADSDLIRIAVYDDSFFCDIAFADDDAVKIEAPSDRVIDWALSENMDAPIFYDNTAQIVSREGAQYSGQTFPVELVLTVK